MRMWDPKDGRILKSFSIDLGTVRVVFVLSDDRIAIGSENGTIRIVDLIGDEEIMTKEKAHDFGVYALLQTSNIYLVSAGQDRNSSVLFNSIKLWNTFDMSLLQNIRTDHSELIRSLCISEDNKLLASSSDDQTIKIWPISIKDVQSS